MSSLTTKKKSRCSKLKFLSCISIALVVLGYFRGEMTTHPHYICVLFGHVGGGHKTQLQFTIATSYIKRRSVVKPDCTLVHCIRSLDTWKCSGRGGGVAIRTQMGVSWLWGEASHDVTPISMTNYHVKRRSVVKPDYTYVHCNRSLGALICSGGGGGVTTRTHFGCVLGRRGGCITRRDSDFPCQIIMSSDGPL